MEIPDDVLMLEVEGEGDRCDFCNRSDSWPGKDYACGEVKTGFVTFAPSVWAACGPCAKMIDAADWEALAQRAAESRNPEIRDLFLFQIRKTHQAVMKSRTGIQ